MAQNYSVNIVTKVSGYASVQKLEKAIADLNKKNAQVTRSTLTFEKSLQNLKRVSNSTAGAVAKTGAASATAAKGMRATGFAALSASGGVKSFGLALSAALGPIALITGGLAAVSKSLKIFADRQADAAVLESSLKNLGVNGARSLEVLLGAADRLGKQTLFDQEEFTKGFNLLTSFRTIGVGSYERVASAAADMSQKLGTDLNSSLLQLAKALEAPEVGLTALQRSGTRFTEQQKEQIKTLVESGRRLEAQKLILQEIEKQYGGAAQEAGSAGLAGALDSAGEASRDLAEGIGQILTPAVEEFLVALTPIIQKLADFVNYVGQIPGVAGAASGATGGLAAMMQETGEKVEYTGMKVDELFLKYQELSQLGSDGTPLLSLEESVEASEKLNAAADTTTKSFAEAAEAHLGISRSADGLLSSSVTQTQLDKELAALKAMQAASVKDLAAAQREYQASLGGEQGDISRELSVKQAILAAEKQINDAKIQQAQADLQSATSLGEKEAAIQRIYELTVTNARLERDATNAAADAELRKVNAALTHATILDQQIRAEVALARSKGIVNDAQQEALKNAAELVRTAQAEVLAQERINEAVRTGSAAMLDKALKAAEVTREMQLTTARAAEATSNITAGANEASRLADNLQRASSAASSINTGGVSAGGGGGGGKRYTDSSWTPVYDKYKVDPKTGNIVETTDLERRRQLAQQLAQGMNTSNRFSQARAQAGHGIYNSLRGAGGGGSTVSTAFAEGGYVTGPTQALIGEGGENEYVIPESKLPQAMANYAAGKRGSSMIPDSANVSINYSGSTVNMGGNSYINKGDVNGIVSQAVNQTLTTLKKSPKARLEAGLR